MSRPFYDEHMSDAWTIEENQQLVHQAYCYALQYSQPDEIPIGALIADKDHHVIGYGVNTREATTDPLAHAEVCALQQAAHTLGTWNLSSCTLAVTLEPCPMCAGAAVMAHIGRIIFGAWDDKMGACGSVWDIPRDPHVGAFPEIIGGINEKECLALLTRFFHQQRSNN